jgi:hypothetical protein
LKERAAFPTNRRRQASQETYMALNKDGKNDESILSNIDRVVKEEEQL